MNQCEEFDIEKYIRELPWSKDRTDYERTLIAGNLRTLYGLLTPLKSDCVRMLVSREDLDLILTRANQFERGSRPVTQQEMDIYHETWKRLKNKVKDG